MIGEGPLVDSGWGNVKGTDQKASALQNRVPNGASTVKAYEPRIPNCVRSKGEV